MRLFIAMTTGKVDFSLSLWSSEVIWENVLHTTVCDDGMNDLSAFLFNSFISLHQLANPKAVFNFLLKTYEFFKKKFDSCSHSFDNFPLQQQMARSQIGAKVQLQ